MWAAAAAAGAVEVEVVLRRRRKTNGLTQELEADTQERVVVAHRAEVTAADGAAAARMTSE